MTATLSADGVVAGYVRGMPIIHGASVRVEESEIVTIVGPNGAGKSTLLKAMAGIVRIEEGRVTLSGHDVTGVATHTLVNAGIAFVPQTGNVFSNLTVHENLVIGGHTLGRELPDRLESAYALFPVLRDRRTLAGGMLSGGQRQVLAVARALMTAPRFLMLDEPTAGLSPKIVTEVFQDLKRLASTGLGVLMVEQNAKAALRISDRGYVLAEGRNRIEGPAQDLLDDPAVADAFLGGTRVKTP